MMVSSEHPEEAFAVAVLKTVVAKNAQEKEGSQRASGLSIWVKTESSTPLSMDYWTARAPEKPSPQMLYS